MPLNNHTGQSVKFHAISADLPVTVLEIVYINNHDDTHGIYMLKYDKLKVHFVNIYFVYHCFNTAKRLTSAASVLSHVTLGVVLCLLLT